jgi:gas vesicle protein GvpG
MLTSFLGWVLRTVASVAEAEMDDDASLREQLLEAAMRRETGELSDEEFAEIEADLLRRIGEVRERRGESGPLALGSEPIDMSGDAQVQVEASVTGDFHERADAPHTTVIETTPDHEERVTILDLKPGQIEGTPAPGLPLSAPSSSARLRVAPRSRPQRSSEASPELARTKRERRAARTSRKGRISKP